LRRFHTVSPQIRHASYYADMTHTALYLPPKLSPAAADTMAALATASIEITIARWLPLHTLKYRQQYRAFEPRRE